MIIPVRCFSCGKVIADKWDEFKKRVRDDHEDPVKVFAELGIERYCCKRMLSTHVDEYLQLLRYATNPGERVAMDEFPGTLRAWK